MRVTLQNALSFALFFLWKNVLDLQLMCTFSFIFPQALIAFPRQAQPAKHLKQNKPNTLLQDREVKCLLTLQRSGAAQIGVSAQMLRVFQCKTHLWKSSVNIFLVNLNKQVSPSKDERLSAEPNRRTESISCHVGAATLPFSPAVHKSILLTGGFWSWSSSGHTWNIPAELLPHRQQLQLHIWLGGACPQNLSEEELG